MTCLLCKSTQIPTPLSSSGATKPSTGVDHALPALRLADKVRRALGQVRAVAVLEALHADQVEGAVLQPTRAPTRWQNIYVLARTTLAGGVSPSQRSALNAD